jgi:hypothetical protein
MGGLKSEDPECANSVVNGEKGKEDGWKLLAGMKPNNVVLKRNPQKPPLHLYIGLLLSPQYPHASG